jgi:hypothetical protein
MIRSLASHSSALSRKSNYTSSTTYTSVSSSTSYATTGSAAISTSQAYVGSSSLYLPSSSGSCVVMSSFPASQLSGNWTVEFYVYVPADFTGPGVPLGIGNGTGTYFYTSWSSGQVYFYMGSASYAVNTFDLVNGTSAAYTSGGWNHVAVCSDCILTSYSIYLNGTQVASTSSTAGRMGTKFTQWNFGNYLTSAGAQSGGGNGLYIDYVYVSDCVRYSGTSFTVPNYIPIDSYTVYVNSFETSLSGGESSYRTLAYNSYAVTVGTGTYKFGSAALATTSASSAAGGYLQIVGLDTSQFAGSWTIEVWIYPTTTASATWASNQGVFASGSQGPNTLWGVALAGGTGTLSMWAGSSASHTSTTPTFNAWNHIAMVCSGGSTYLLFLNGSLLTTLTTSSVAQYMASISVGVLNNYKGALNAGYIDEVRVSSVARYTSSFTPDSSAFTSDSSTIFLNHFDGATNGSTDWSTGQAAP